MSDVDEPDIDELRRDIQLVQRSVHTRRYRSALSFVGDHAVIDFLDEPTFDDWGTMTIGTWGGYLIQVMPMIYNDRLIMTPAKAPGVYDFGWCYEKGVAAIIAAFAWNPDAHDEPAGFIKRIGPRRVARDTTAWSAR